MLSRETIISAIYMGVFFAFLVSGISMIADSIFNYDEQTLNLGLLFIFFAFIPFIIIEVRSNAMQETYDRNIKIYGERLERILVWIEGQMEEEK